MGVDFLKSKQKEFAKGWDKEQLAASHRRLFESGALAYGSEVVARIIGPNGFREGEDVLVRADGERLSVLVDLAPAAVFLEPTPDIVNAVREGGGYAGGTIQASYPTLGIIKVQLK